MDPCRRARFPGIAGKRAVLGPNRILVWDPSRHLRVLRDAGVVASRADAQRRIYRLDPAPLDEVSAWLARTRAFWSGRLDALEVELRGDPS